MFRKKWFWIVVVLLVIGGGAGASFARRGDTGITVTAETIQKRDLEAIVSASGKIDPKKTVNISAQTMGRVTQLAVKEGDRVSAGQFLLQIDPVNAEAAVRRDVAAVAGRQHGARAVERVGLQSARASLDVARQALKRQQELTAAGLTTRESLERAQAEVEIRESDLKAREQEIKNRETQLNQQEAGLAQQPAHADAGALRGAVRRHRHAPQHRRGRERDGRHDEQRRHGAADGRRHVGDRGRSRSRRNRHSVRAARARSRRSTIDAIADKKFTGTVTEIGNSPIQAAGAGTTRTATNFKVTVTIDGQIPEVRPGFTCTAEITTATKKQAVSVPIQSMTVRELLYDAQGNVVHEPRPPRRDSSFGPPRPPAADAAGAAELKPGQKREEVEGVFLMQGRQGRVRDRQDSASPASAISKCWRA